MMLSSSCTLIRTCFTLQHRRSWMPAITLNRIPYICARYLRVRNPSTKFKSVGSAVRQYASNSTPPKPGDDGEQADAVEEKHPGAMSRRLQEMSEQSLETGGRSAKKAVAEAGFSETLKRDLEKKIADASFRSENASAFAQVNMPVSAGKGTRDIAAAQPWFGIETVEDVSLRMLNDAHKPLRTASKIPSIRGPPSKVDTGRPKGKPGTGNRLAAARDRSSAYTATREDQQGLTDEEREKFRQQLKARYQPGARAVAASISGLQSLANERIEDAIARGQFKNLPDRGKKIERDHNANSPFINTTEYFMNKMIKKQEIVPPWIEKQQEIVSTANTFRRRLRSDWKRHVSRSIASRGGSLKSQIELADEYAYAERLANPTKKQLEPINTVDNQGHMSQIAIPGNLKAEPIEDSTAIEEEIQIMEQTFNDDGSLKRPTEKGTIITEQPLSTQAAPSEGPRRATVSPFRDPQWEEVERSYHSLAIQNLNSITRSYNLMAPDLAKKPYFSLERELNNCYAEVAPQVALAIRERAYVPKSSDVRVVGHTPSGLLEKFSMSSATHIRETKTPHYGLKELWRDLFATKS